MPIPRLQKRTYGYISDEEKKKAAATKREPKKSGIGRLFFVIALFPFRALGFLWQKRLRRSALSILLIAGVFGFLALTIMVAWASRDLPDPDRLTDRHMAQSTKIYDRTGKHLLYEIFAAEKRTIIELEDVPQRLIQGVLATEDTKFYEHSGIRPLSMLRSVVYGIFGRGRVGGGASTLTQQLVKNAILTNERTLTRKMKEIILSIRLEQKYTKGQILKIYFNEIPYGSTNYGVEAAAQSYFGKHAKDLDLQEAATLAGLPKAPTYYLNNPDALKGRRNFVLERMFVEGYITKEEKGAAQTEPLSLEQRYANIKAPHFVLYVKEILTQRFGEQLVETGGLRVITTLDWEKQQAAEETVSSTKKIFNEAGANNASLVAIDPKTGHILALVGSRDFFDESINGQFNVATQGLRQPGSSFKPIVYALGFEKGYTPDTLLFDVLTNFTVPGSGQKDYQPVNYDGKEHGVVTVRTALQGSFNIPAVQMLYLAQPGAVIKLAERLGYTTLSKGDYGLSLVLGGGEVKLLEHTAAYAVFAAGGVRHTPTPLLRVEDPRGDVLYEWKKGIGERVLSETTVATLSDVLSDDAARAPVFGARGILTLPDRPVAAKTGTTNNYVDAWTLGYTPSLAAGVWAGNTDNTPLKPGFGGGRVAGTIWNNFMRAALEKTPVESFPAPPPNTADKPILRGSALGITLLVNRVTGNIAASSTPPELIVERSFIPLHSILHYVRKDDPRGSPPERPEEDPQYGIWELAIQNWIRRMREENPNWDVRFDDPPATFDTAGSLAFVPMIEIISPAPSSTLASRRIAPDIRVSAVRGIARVIYKIDDRYIGTAERPPFTIDAYIPDLADGAHTLVIIAEDDGGARRITEIPFFLFAGEEPPRVDWVERTLTLREADFPRTLFLNHFKLDQIARIRIFLKRQNEEATTQLSTIEDFGNLFNNQILIRWDAVPEQGTWELIAEIETKTGARTITDRFPANIQ